MLNYDFVPSDGSDLGALIAQIICKDPLRAARAGQKSADAMTKIIRRSLGKTGSVLFRTLKAGFRGGWLNIPQRQIYTKTGAVISSQIKRYPPVRGIDNRNIIPATSNPPVGQKFSGLMQYYMNDKNERDISTLEVGLIPSRRGGGGKWDVRFSDWQEAGVIKIPYGNNRKMRTYLEAIDLALKAGKVLRRPARPVIEQVQKLYNPFDLFEKHFVERLSRGLR